MDRDMVLKLPEFENLKPLKALCSEDAEQDFFNNIIHLQKHRRAKALSRFSNVVSNSIVPEGILNKVFVPLYFNMLFDLHSGKAGHVKIACIEALASIAARVERNLYYSLLKLLSGDILDSQLPSIIHRIENHLKNRMESIRDEARLALAACLKELGLEYLQFVVGVLRATLKQGYELHVLGYSQNFILSKFLSFPICGKLDYCLEDLLSVVEIDILGDVAEEKEVEKIASKMKETRKLESFETLKIIAQSVTFKSHSLKLLSPVNTYMQKHLTPKLKNKLESMLNNIASGIECNPSVDQTDLLIFIYGFVEDFINEENGQSENSCMESVPNRKHSSSGNKISSGKVIRTKSGCSHLIAVFPLGLLHSRMKSEIGQR
ncbi:U3 small nucleolar RNA-associated protein 20-like [Euphorbia lathyris]|uniref:U3 small nucleolar RNA-associated protein 20-like n=1 Tax=Euphorbia lathyris TaxID=212925 RepID=UPI003313730E